MASKSTDTTKRAKRLSEMDAAELQARLDRIREDAPESFARLQSYRTTAAALRRLEDAPSGTKLSGLTALNTRALAEVFPAAVEEGDLILTTTTAEWTRATPSLALATIEARMSELPTRGHPRASLHAVTRKLGKLTAATPEVGAIVVDGEKLAGQFEKVGKTEEAAEVRAMATKRSTRKAAASPAVEAETPDLTKALLDGLKAEGIEARAAVSPKGNFYRVEIDEKTTIAFVNFRAKGALRIEPRIEKLPAKLQKVFADQPKPRQGLFFVATFADEKSLPPAVEALKLAAEKAREGKEA